MSLLKPPETEKLPPIEAKVVVLGTQGVGKTSLVLRHVGNTFSRSVSPTIGASFFTFSMTVNGFRIKLQLWDTAGQERCSTLLKLAQHMTPDPSPHVRFRSMAPMYYRRANAAIIVYDITQEKSFNEARDWAKELENKVDSKLAMCIVGNKCDLFDQREVSRDKGEEFAHQLGAMFTETSASENIGVKETFLKVAQGVIALFQCNELVANNAIEPSYSPLNSCTPTQHLYSSPYYHSHPNHLEPNGRVTVPHDRKSSTSSQDSFLHKCCGG